MPLVTLKGKDIPFDEKGDPAFEVLGTNVPLDVLDLQTGAPKNNKPSILSQFTPDEIVTMVNRYLYQAFYNRNIHKQRSKDETARLSVVKRKIREMFHTSHLKATPQQIEQALAAVKEEEQHGTEKVE